MNRVYLSIGSNINAEQNLKALMDLLREQTTVIAVSPVYESPDALGNATVYLNAAVIIETPHALAELKATVLIPIEAELGRRHGETHVTVDIDIVLVNEDILEYAGRAIPEPELLVQPYIALPLADIAPDYVHPVDGRTLRAIADGLNNGNIRQRDDLILA